MAEHDPTADTDVEQLDARDARALTESMMVLDDVGRARGAPGLFLVVAKQGGAYLVDVETGACECPDHEYRSQQLGQRGCKHRRRVAFATGERAIPAWVDRDAVDPGLGEHVDDEVRVIANDGGAVIDAGGEGDDCGDEDEQAAGPTGHRIDDPLGDGAGERPSDYAGNGENTSVIGGRCWPWDSEGFDEPSPDATVEDE